MRTYFTGQMFITLVTLVTGLCTLEKKITCNRIADELGVTSHDAMTRILKDCYWNASILIGELINLAIFVASGTKLPCYLILDDVIVPKPFAKNLPGAYYDWDYVNKRKVLCHRLVVLVWTNGIFVIPVAFSLWHKKNSDYLIENKLSYRTKNDIARCLIYKIIRRGLPFAYITFDSWYASKKNLNMLTQLGVAYYAAIPGNRKIAQAYRVSSKEKVALENIKLNKMAAQYTVKEYTPYSKGKLRAISLFANMNGLNHGIRIILVRKHGWNRFIKKFMPDAELGKEKDPNKYLITNDILGCTTFQVIERYRSRWTIEIMFRDLKQHLGLCNCQHRDLQAIIKYFALCMFAYVCLQLLRQDLVSSSKNQKAYMTIGDVKKHLKSQLLIKTNKPIPAMMIERLHQKPMPKKVFELLIDSTKPDVISISEFLNLQSIDFKELIENA